MAGRAKGTRKGASWLALVGSLLLLSKALGSAAVALSGWPPSDGAEAFAILWFAVPLLLVGAMLVGALVVRASTSRPKLWGWLILVSGSLQIATGWSPLGSYPPSWLPQELRFLEEPLLILGVLLGAMSGIWLITENRSRVRKGGDRFGL